MALLRGGLKLDNLLLNSSKAVYFSREDSTIHQKAARGGSAGSILGENVRGRRHRVRFGSQAHTWNQQLHDCRTV